MGQVGKVFVVRQGRLSEEELIASAGNAWPVTRCPDPSSSGRSCRSVSRARC
ncbi:hypothetical protein [Streptomyces sp. S.PB5]|uniref:hypothetical protein n=1 Tax=Streptomyces sp. S.PB5 TaxID=3020844 RepID=UPI0025B0957C|nr:hypothetical protein [Streptomyces sp. S.PB5]MDN3026932.1 hypothetical protein [Streptomyces sp. S.PB5]